MNANRPSVSLVTPPPPKGAGSASFVQDAVRRRLLAKLAGLRVGRLTLRDGQTVSHFGPGGEGPVAELVVHDPEFYVEAGLGGSVGAAEAYMRGRWDCAELPELVRLMVLNRAVLEGMEGGLGRLGALTRQLFHRLRRNTIAGARRNIVAHYDLSNDFFGLFLDPTMMYSSAIFERPGMSLEEASQAKNRRICQKLALTPADHLVEIGTGWGGFALHAAGNFGCRVTTTTISDQQFELASRRVAEAGLQERVTVLKQDYRTLQGRFDKLVSIEMIEAVGHRFYNQYFGTCSKLLKPDGLMCLQAIVIDDRQYESAKRSVDFIQRYIFPGSCLPSVAAICQTVKQATDLQLFHFEDITEHYADTLRIWRENFFRRLPEVRAMGFSEAFVRMWEYYLCYCEGGFRERAIGDVQMVFAKPRCRRPALLGDLGSAPLAEVCR